MLRYLLEAIIGDSSMSLRPPKLASAWELEVSMLAFFFLMTSWSSDLPSSLAYKQTHTHS